MQDIESACIRCVTTAMVHSLDLRADILEAAGIDIAPEAADLPFDDYVNELVRITTHGHQPDIQGWVDALSSVDEPEDIRKIWTDSIAQAKGRIPASCFDGTENHIELLGKSGKTIGAFAAVDAYYAGVPAADIVA